MATPVLMPRQGQSVETCIMGKWYKKPGDRINEGDLLFSYETDKATFDEEAKTDGILLAVFFEEGDEVPVLVNVAIIGMEGESVDEFKPGYKSSSEKPPEDLLREKLDRRGGKKDSMLENQKSIKASPLAKKMAEELNMNLSAINGSGPHGRIIARDIRAAQINTTSETYSAGNFEIKPLTNIRKLIAAAMHQSLQNSAQVTHHLSADARTILHIRKEIKTRLEAGEFLQNITINDMACFAVVKSLLKYPRVNSHFLGDKMKWFKKVHLGLAIDTERGLMVPVVQNADNMTIEELSLHLAKAAASARSGDINPDLLNPEAATFTVSNLGNYGVEMFTPVINLPQTAILGVCTIIPRPKDLGDGVYGFVPTMGLSLTYNHQAIDGGEATKFLVEIRNQIETMELSV